MNNYNEFVYTKGVRRDQLTPDKRIPVRYGEVRSGFEGGTVTGKALSSASLAWEILETAYFLFRKKGFDRTTIPDICSRLGIRQSQFYHYFDSLDEVLEILWAR